jgi:hypothetical protein
MKFHALVKNGKLEIKNHSAFAEFLQTLDGECVFEIEKFRKDRTSQQNRLYWFYLGLVSESSGDSATELHETFKRLFLPPRWLKTKYGEMKVPASTTKLNKIEFGEYLDRIAERTGVSVPQTDIV